MNYSAISTSIKLSYPPLSNREFSIIKDESVVQNWLQDASIYIITQRSLLTFEQLDVDQDDIMSFEIHLKGTDNKLQCSMPVRQDNIVSKPGVYDIEFGYNDPEHCNEAFPFNNVAGLKFFDSNKEFLCWINPDNFLYDYSYGNLIATVSGDLKPFLTFNVLYVGKSTDQNIWDRLNGHRTLQSILSLVKPVVKGNLPTNEIVLLLFKISESSEIRSHNLDKISQLTEGEASSKGVPSNKTISLDVEKALIKLLSPKFNHTTKRFKNYPESKDGLYPYGYNEFIYQVADNLTLNYEHGSITGHIDLDLAEVISIKDDHTMEILKRSM